MALHTGEAIVGQIGTEKRPKWGTFGAPLDLVSRLETYTVGGQVLISEATFKAAGPEVRASGQMAVRTRAAAEPLTAFEVRGLAGKWSLFLTERAPSTIRLERPGLRALLHVRREERRGNGLARAAARAFDEGSPS